MIGHFCGDCSESLALGAGAAGMVNLGRSMNSELVEGKSGRGFREKPACIDAKRVLGVEENNNPGLYLECLLLDLSKLLGDDSSVI